MEISKNIKEYYPIEGLSLFVSNIKNSNIITIFGSFPGGDIHTADKNPLIPHFCASMLDKGSTKKTREQIAKAIESIGVSISFSTSPKFTNFVIKSRKEKVEPALLLLKELLYEPNFPKKQLDILKKNIINSLEQEKEDTRKRASDSFKRSIFKNGHPNYSYTIEEKIKLIKEITIKNLREFHKKYFGLSDIKISTAGASSRSSENTILEVFKGVRKINTKAESKDTSKLLKEKSAKQIINIPDKDNVDVFWGQPLPFSKKSSDYLPCLLATSILGNGFIARLMKNVRDKKGLTYGTTSRLGGFDDGFEGFWFAFGMFSPALLNNGVEATEEELKKIFEKGVTEKELKQQKDHITGLYKINLSNTEAISSKILDIKEGGLPISYIDEFVEKINSITKKQVEDALSKYFNPKRTCSSVAGTIK